jgi:hypothetical protein
VRPLQISEGNDFSIRPYDGGVIFLDREPHDSMDRPPIDLFGTRVFAS